MQQFDLKTYLKNPHVKLKTRCGLSVKIMGIFNIHTETVILAMLGQDGPEIHSGFMERYPTDGLYSNSKNPHPYDIFFATEKKEGWINVRKYKEDTYVVGKIYDNEKEAKKDGWNRSAMTIKIKWEE